MTQGKKIHFGFEPFYLKKKGGVGGAFKKNKVYENGEAISFKKKMEMCNFENS